MPHAAPRPSSFESPSAARPVRLGRGRGRVAGAAHAALAATLAVAAFAAIAAVPSASARTGVLLPGRPPIGPLARDVGRVYDVAFTVQLDAVPPFQPVIDDREVRVGRAPTFVNPVGDVEFLITGGMIAMPVPVISTWHRTELETVGATLRLDDRSVPETVAAARLSRTLPFDVQRAEIPVPAFEGRMIRFEFRQRTTVWASLIDDAAAAELPWPERYPEDVVDGLQPSPGIPSDDPYFATVVQELFGADVTAVAPYLAAKRIAGHVARDFRVIGPRVARGLANSLDGLVVDETVRAARQGQGHPLDLINITVAVMRAAGIPARPVIGVTAADDLADEIRDRETITTWAEFYLDGAGWVPFDPEKLQGNGSWRNIPPNRAWPNFGTWDDLNERVPMAYQLFPGEDVRPAQRPAIYGVRLEGGASRSPAQYITISLVSRGRS